MFWSRKSKSEEPPPQPLTIPVFVSVNGLQHRTELVFDPESHEMAQLDITHGHVETANREGRSLTLIVWDVS